ncbi:MAG: hypothetical protein KA467_02280, partial [Bacteroidales bacterium]|nr:hypothetical protein [Bacteroidales bacterium]
MKNINNYQNLAAYTADVNRPTDQNTVSLIKDVNIIKRNGVNVIVPSIYCSVGDTVVYDTVEEKYKVIKNGTVNRALLSSRYIITGVVASRTNTSALIDAGVEVSKQWGAPNKVKMSGFSFVADGSFTITINSTTTAIINYTTTDTLATLATKMQDAIRAIMTVHPAGWTVTAYAGYIVVEQNSYTPNITSFTCSEPGISKQILTGNYQTALTGLLTPSTQIYRNDGTAEYFAGANFWKFKQYYSVSGGDLVNQTSTSAGVIRESRFNATDNPILFYYYKTYDNYLQAKMVKKSYSKGIITDKNGQSNTKGLAIMTYTNHDGTISPAYPAADYCNSYAVAGTKHLAGSWWLPSVWELEQIISKITNGITGMEQDAMTNGFIEAGLTPVTGSMYKSSCEYNSLYSWVYNNVTGAFYHAVDK